MPGKVGQVEIKSDKFFVSLGKETITSSVQPSQNTSPKMLVQVARPTDIRTLGRAAARCKAFSAHSIVTQ